MKGFEPKNAGLEVTPCVKSLLKRKKEPLKK